MMMLPYTATITTTNLCQKRKLSECSTQGDSFESRSHLKNPKITGRRSARRRSGQWHAPMLFLSCSADQPTFILKKKLTLSDINPGQARLLLTRTELERTPLLEFLNSEENGAVFYQGLAVQVLDKHGREYKMLLRFAPSSRAYRLIHKWTKFLEENASELKAGDAVEIWAFCIMKEDGSRDICMRLLHYGKEEEPRREQNQAAAVTAAPLRQKRKHKQPIQIREETEIEDELMSVADALLMLQKEPVVF